MHQRGFSLFEVIVVIGIIGITAGIGIPSFRDTIQNNRITTTSNELLTAIALARNSAIQQNTNVQVCASEDPDADAPVCKEDSNSWSEGWVVLADSNRDGDFENKLLGKSLAELGVTVDSTGGANVAFQRTGLLVGFNNTSFGICDERDKAAYYSRMRNLVVSAAGRARVATPSSAGDLVCE